MLSLPDDLHVHCILPHLESNELLTLRLVCKQSKKLVQLWTENKLRKECKNDSVLIARHRRQMELYRFADPRFDSELPLHQVMFIQRIEKPFRESFVDVILKRYNARTRLSSEEDFTIPMRCLERNGIENLVLAENPSDDPRMNAAIKSAILKGPWWGNAGAMNRSGSCCYICTSSTGLPLRLSETGMKISDPGEIRATVIKSVLADWHSPLVPPVIASVTRLIKENYTELTCEKESLYMYLRELENGRIFVVYSSPSSSSNNNNNNGCDQKYIKDAKDVLHFVGSHQMTFLQDTQKCASRHEGDFDRMNITSFYGFTDVAMVFYSKALGKDKGRRAYHIYIWLNDLARKPYEGISALVRVADTEQTYDVILGKGHNRNFCRFPCRRNSNTIEYDTTDNVGYNEDYCKSRGPTSLSLFAKMYHAFSSYYMDYDEAGMPSSLCDYAVHTYHHPSHMFEILSRIVELVEMKSSS